MAKLEREYAKGIVNNLSFQRFNDREIVQSRFPKEII